MSTGTTTGAVPETPSMPEKETDHFVEVSKKDKHGNHTYICKYCNWKGKGTATILRGHMTGISEGGARSLKCTKIPAEIKKIFVEKTEQLLAGKKRKSASSLASLGFKRFFTGTTLDQVMMNAIVECDLPVSIVDKPAFKELLEAVRADSKAGMSNRKAYGKDGKVLAAALNSAQQESAIFFKLHSQMSDGGGSLMVDGARNVRKNSNNSVLKTRKMPGFFVQCTDATGKYKSKEWHFIDMETAILLVGLDFVSILCVDGLAACQWARRKLEEKYPNLWGMRCVTHAYVFLLVLIE